MRTTVLAILGFLTLLASSTALADDVLEAGFGVVDITPELSPGSADLAGGQGNGIALPPAFTIRSLPEPSCCETADRRSRWSRSTRSACPTLPSCERGRTEGLCLCARGQHPFAR